MYENLEECILDLEKHGHLVRIEEEVDPYLEMAAIQRRLYREGGPAVLFERVKGSKYRAVANLFGTMERSKFLFRKNWHKVEQVIALRDDPMKAAKRPLQQLGNGLSALKALPMRKPGLNGSQLEEISLSDIPLSIHGRMMAAHLLHFRKCTARTQISQG